MQQLCSAKVDVERYQHLRGSLLVQSLMLRQDNDNSHLQMQLIVGGSFNSFLISHAAAGIMEGFISILFTENIL